MEEAQRDERSLRMALASLRMAVAFYVTGISPPESTPNFHHLEGR